MIVAVVSGDLFSTSPQPVALADRMLPEANGAVLGARAVDLSVRTVADTVHRAKVALV